MKFKKGNLEKQIKSSKEVFWCKNVMSNQRPRII